MANIYENDISAIPKQTPYKFPSGELIFSICNV